MSVFEIYKNILTCMLLKEMDVVTTNTESAVANPSPPLPSPGTFLPCLSRDNPASVSAYICSKQVYLIGTFNFFYGDTNNT